MRHVGIVGAGEEKFTELGRQNAKAIIRGLLGADVSVVSGHSPKGGVDIWAEEMAGEGRAVIFHPAIQKWEGGYKDRNMQIAQHSDELHVIVPRDYPIEYKGKRTKSCFHCGTNDHVHSAACWTAKRFEEIHKKKAVWHTIENI